MKKLCKLFILLCFCSTILSGCRKNETKPLCRTVTAVDISCQQEDVLIQRHYTDSRKMEYVLLYLRLLEPIGTPDTDPDEVDADVYRITLQLSDGEEKIYRQKDHRYLSAGSQPWKSISPAQAAGLYQLMRSVPSDMASNANQF